MSRGSSCSSIVSSVSSVSSCSSIVSSVSSCSSIVSSVMHLPVLSPMGRDPRHMWGT